MKVHADLFGTVFEWIESIPVAGTLLAMVATIEVQVMARHVFNVPLSWTGELVRYLFIWLVFLGAPQAMRRGEHIAIGLFFNVLPRPLHTTASIFINTLVAAFLAVLVVMGWKVVGVVGPLESIALKVSMAVVYLPLVAGGAAMLVRTRIVIVRTIRRGVDEIGDGTL